MTVTQAMHELLIGEAAVGEIANGGVYPSGQPKQGAQPNYVMHEIIGTSRPPLLNGVCRNTNYQWRITAVCKSESELRRLMDAIQVRCDGYKGGEIRGCQYVDASSNPNPDDPTTHSESHTYSVWHVRPQVGGNE